MTDADLGTGERRVSGVYFYKSSMKYGVKINNREVATVPHSNRNCILTVTTH